MIKEAMERLLELADEPQQTIGNRNFMKTGYTEIPPPSPKAIRFFTLQSFKEFIEMQEARDDAFVHVVSPTEVEFIGELTDRQTRKSYAVAHVMIDGSFDVGQWMGQEKFITDVQAYFAPNLDKDRLLKIAGNVRRGEAITLEDDGITQKVATAAGVASQVMEEMPNPVTLQPYETFPEIIQPERKYIVRFKGGGENEAIHFALFTVPDPTYSQKTCADIKIWLSSNLPVTMTVLG